MSVVSRAIELLQEEGIGSLAYSAAEFARYEIGSFVNFFRAFGRHTVYRLRYHSSFPDPYRLRWIDPRRIEYVQCPSFQHQRSRHGTYIIGGDWDVRESSKYVYNRVKAFDEQTCVPIERYVYYESFERHFLQGVPWEQTEIYEWLSDGGISRYQCSDVGEVLRNVDKLYEMIESGGYKSQSELHTGRKLYSPALYEIQVNVGRDGRLVLDDGRHRLLIARLLGLDEIPVRVYARHPSWMSIRAATLEDGVPPADSLTGGDEVHPDLEDCL